MQLINNFLYVYIIALLFATGNFASFFVPYLWRNIEFQFPSDQIRDALIRNGSYISQNIIINDVDVWEDPIKGRDTGGHRVFISTPRMVPGVPVTLSTVTNIRKGESFLLAPFPDLQFQTIDETCNGFVLVDKIHIDKCGLLWSLDTGRINEFVRPKRVCPSKLIIFELKNKDEIVERYVFPDGVVTPGSMLTTIVTDSRTDTCRDSIAFIADLAGNSLVVFDWTKRTSWRVTHTYFYPYPRWGTHTIAGVTFDLMDGIFGMSLGPRKPDNNRILYFHSLASVRESWVSISVLKNQELVQQPNQYRSQFSLSGEFREGQCSLEVMTDDGIMIYNDLPRNAIMCWNTAHSASIENTQMLYQDNVHLQFISGLKLKGDQLWIASNQAQNLLGNVTTRDFRFRIVLIKSVHTLLQERGKKCLEPSEEFGLRGPALFHKKP